MSRYRSYYRYRRTKKNAFWTPVLFLFAGCYLASALFLGIALSQRWPIPANDAVLAEQAVFDDAVSLPAEPEPAADPSPADALIQDEEQEGIDVELPALPVFAVAQGPYASAADAGQQALLILARGGAGYVQERDGQSYVLYCAYDRRESAEKVMQRLVSGDGQPLQVLDLSAPPFRLSITTGRLRAERIKESYSNYLETLKRLDEGWRALDKGEMQPADALVEIGLLSDQLEAIRAQAFDGTLIEGDAQALQTWNDSLSRAAKYLQTIYDTDQSALAISAKIKYTYLAIVMQYRSYIEGLSQ